MPPRLIEQQNDEVDDLPDIIKELLALNNGFRNIINSENFDYNIIIYSTTLTSLIREIINDPELEWYLYESQELIDDIATLITSYCQIQIEHGYDVQETNVVEFLHSLDESFIHATYQAALNINVIELIDYINENFSADINQTF